MLILGRLKHFSGIKLKEPVENAVKKAKGMQENTLFEIRSRKYVQDYLRIVSDPTFGRNRQMLVLLLGKLKEESAIPVLIDLLEDEEVRLHAISALGQFKREEFRGYFERFQNASHAGWRKYAREALKKLDK